MPLDIEATLEAMADAAASALGQESTNVRLAVRQVIADQREALADIAAARLAGDIDDAQLEVQIRDEKVAFKAGLSMARALRKASVQKAANAAFDILVKAIRGAIGS